MEDKINSNIFGTRKFPQGRKERGRECSIENFRLHLILRKKYMRKKKGTVINSSARLFIPKIDEKGNFFLFLFVYSFDIISTQV